MFTPFMLGLLLLTWYVRHNGFFWDSILLASKYGQWYYQTNFSTLFVPQEMAGYPPLFGLYLAAGWHMFGKTVPVSHFLMLPFLLGIVWQVYLLSRRYLPLGWVWLGLLLALLDPTWLAQSTLVAPDILLLFLYLLAVNSFLQEKRGLQVLALLFMAVLSPRSQLLIPAVFLTEVLFWWLHSKQFRGLEVCKIMLPYVPAGLLLLGWLWLHYRHFGWIGYNRSSDWGAYSHFISGKEFLRNLGLMAWRLLDFGRVGLWLLVAVLLWQSRQFLSTKTKELLVLMLVPLVTLSLVLVWFTNPIGHRYYLVVYVFLGILSASLLAYHTRAFARKAAIAVAVLSLLSGHFWQYPATVAKGWDASLAYLPYFSIRKQMMTYLDQEQIAWQEVGSDFPNLAAPAFTDLSHDQRAFAPKDFASQRYMLHSNVFNGFTDQELLALENHWRLVKEVKQGQVFFRLYTKK